jgi:hypothetical protein
MADKEKAPEAAVASVEEVPVEEVKPASEMSGKEIKDALVVSEDAKLHPSGEPDSETEKEPGGPPALEPNRPPYATNRPDEPILSRLATGSGAHTPPDPATVDSDGSVRPLAAESK